MEPISDEFIPGDKELEEYEGERPTNLEIEHLVNMAGEKLELCHDRINEVIDLFKYAGIKNEGSLYNLTHA